jgi:hypothetical protein
LYAVILVILVRLFAILTDPRIIPEKPLEPPEVADRRVDVAGQRLCGDVARPAEQRADPSRVPCRG